jgi:hypothetical protein
MIQSPFGKQSAAHGDLPDITQMTSLFLSKSFRAVVPAFRRPRAAPNVAIAMPDKIIK